MLLLALLLRGIIPNIGVPTAQVAVYFADICGLELPIFRAVAGILAGSLKLEVVTYLNLATIHCIFSLF
jgi:hypothetical protein